MANPQHTALARKGPYAIARWREGHWRGRVRLDLSGAFLSRARLPHADLNRDSLSHADFTDADLRGADLAGADLRASYLSRSNLARAKLQGADLSGASLLRANLSAASLDEANLSGADLSSADLSCASLQGADLSGATLTETDFSWADLTGARLTNARLTETNLQVANLSGADLRGALLVGAVLDRAIFSGATLERTLVGDCDVSQVMGLEAVRHAGPSIIGLDTLARSGGGIPPGFLRQAGVAEPLVAVQEKLRSGGGGQRSLLVGSMKDVDFIGRLEAHLENAGLTCWRLLVDDEAALITDENALRRASYYDRVLLVCSRNFLENPHGWRFFQQVGRKHAVARPGALAVLALDDRAYALERDNGAALPSQGVVDFRGWEQAGAYGRGVSTLMQLVGGDAGGTARG